MPIKPANRDRYPKEWKRIRERILARSGGRCECRGECGRKHSEICVCFEEPCTCERGRCCELDRFIAATFRGSVVLTIAHLDHEPENCADANLLALCQDCHNRYDRDHRTGTAATTRHERKASGDLFT